ncbi:MAG: YlxR family protein [Defluviitaleaceae bacterium]|nr:YlxR family protein [Defluviitaleaceae bacterium]
MNEHTARRKVPLRKCVGCGQMKVKPELLRVVRAPEGGFAIDPAGKMPGRGAYVCAQAACIAKAQKHKGLERSYKAGVPKEVYAGILAEVELNDV